MDPDVDQTYRFCGEARETFIHFFTDCPALWQARADAEHAQPGGVLSFRSPTQLLNFSFHPRINQALESDQEVEQVWRDMEVISESTITSESETMSVNEGEDNEQATPEAINTTMDWQHDEDRTQGEETEQTE